MSVLIFIICKRSTGKSFANSSLIVLPGSFARTSVSISLVGILLVSLTSIGPSEFDCSRDENLLLHSFFMVEVLPLFCTLLLGPRKSSVMEVLFWLGKNLLNLYCQLVSALGFHFPHNEMRECFQSKVQR